MPLEVMNFIGDIDANNPLGSDVKSEGDDHIRGIKRALAVGTFANFIGTTAAPKTVALTEDQISDAALKSAAQVISGAWEHTVPLLLANDTALQMRASGGVPTDYVKMSLLDRFTVGGAGHHIDHFAPSGSNAFTWSVGGVEMARHGNLADGAIQVKDLSSFFKKTGFRNPSLNSQNADYTFQQSDEGKVVRRTSATRNTWTVPSLEVGTTYTFINASDRNQDIVEIGGISLVALVGGIELTAPFVLGPESVMQIYHVSATRVECWGSGLVQS